MAAAKFGVGPVLTRSRPSLCLSRRSPVGHAPSVNPFELAPSFTVAPVGQPAPFTQRAATRSLSNGSNTTGVTARNRRSSSSPRALSARANTTTTVANRIPIGNSPWNAGRDCRRCWYAIVRTCKISRQPDARRRVRTIESALRISSAIAEPLANRLGLVLQTALAQAGDQVRLRGGLHRVRFLQVELRHRGVVLDALQMGPHQRDQAGQRPDHQEPLGGPEQRAAHAVQAPGDPAAELLVDHLPRHLREDLREDEEDERQRRGGHRRRDAQVGAERLPERGSGQARQQDAAGEAQQAEELPDESAERAPHGEGDQQRDADDVEGHLKPLPRGPRPLLAALKRGAAEYGGYRIVMSFLISLPASSRLDL